jgi:aldehyde dehydrogenase (NAD+)
VVSTLEGKTSMLIYDSADIESAVETIVDGCFYSNGQHRHSLNKVLVQENVYDDVLKRLERRFTRLNAGNHLDKCNDYSKLIDSNERERLRTNLEIQSLQFGAQVVFYFL